MAELLLNAQELATIERLLTPPRDHDGCDTAVLVLVTRTTPPLSVRDRILFRLLAPGVHELIIGIHHRHDVHGLSPSEVRVLELVADGASNREVSDSLFLSVATVRKHLEHVYAKLGVRNRTAAARAFRSN